MKKCSACGETKELSEFNRKGAKYQDKCRECQKIWYKNYYNSSPKEKSRLYLSNLQKREKVRDAIREAKSVPCTDCSVSYPYYVMDFDHTENNKLFNVGSAVWDSVPLETVLQEIAKCDVVCANCHRKRTHERNHSPLV